MSAFKLPDLGEGLQDAEIREWLVKPGDEVQVDQPLLSVETAKAVVEVPSPRAGHVRQTHGEVGDIVEVGAVLVEFEGDAAATANATTEAPTIRDTGVVVGATRSSDEVVAEKATGVGGARAGLKVTPAVRALAHRLDVDLAAVTPTGADGVITTVDVQRVHRIFTEAGPLEKLRGPRRAMAHAMSQARDEVMQVTVTDDAILPPGFQQQDITLQLIHALVAACRAEPALNAWYNADDIGRRVIGKIHLGVAVDTAEGLFVCLLKDVDSRDDSDLRRGLDKMKADAAARRIPPEELRGHTITLSNYGRFGGKYATPAVMPPTVAIVAAGGVRQGVVVIDGQPAVASVLPLSLSFDHRCVTGGEAARFLAAMIARLQSSSG